MKANPGPSSIVTRLVPFIAFAIATISSFGCTIPDLLFATMKDSYTGGGQSCTEKKSHFDQRIREAEAYEKYGSVEREVPSPWNDGT